MMRAPAPVAIVTGMLGSGKTTLIRRLLADPGARDTLVIVNEFGAVGLDHALLKAVTDDVMLLPNGCLCCTVRNDVIQTLRSIRRDWLAGQLGTIERVVIETSGLAEPAPLVQSMLTHPVLTDSFALAAVSTLVDGEYGTEQATRAATCRNQIRLADHLLVSKLDLIDASRLRRLCRELRSLNLLARPRAVTRANVDDLFRRPAGRAPRTMTVCDEANSHLAGQTSVVLRSRGVVRWPDFQAWIAAVLNRSGDRLLRLKGCLLFDTLGEPMIVQAVHRSFYPLTLAPEMDDTGFLVLIYAGDPPAELLHGAAAIGLSP